MKIYAYWLLNFKFNFLYGSIEKYTIEIVFNELVI